MKHLMFVLGILALLLGACAPAVPPTPDAAQVQASAIAGASTMIAQTIQAQPPTPTVTDTPEPTLTPTIAPTLELPTASAPTATASGGNNCVHPLQMSAAGPKHPTLIKNETGAVINLSLNLYKPNLFGECGAISFAGMGKNDTESIGLPSGDWYAYAWAGSGKNFTVSGTFYVQPGYYQTLQLCIRANFVKYAQSC